jgi:hypothetical protein
MDMQPEVALASQCVVLLWGEVREWSGEEFGFLWVQFDAEGAPEFVRAVEEPCDVVHGEEGGGVVDEEGVVESGS